jgi:hypothetical protein
MQLGKLTMEAFLERRGGRPHDLLAFGRQRYQYISPILIIAMASDKPTVDESSQNARNGRLAKMNLLCQRSHGDRLQPLNGLQSGELR